MTAIVTFQSAEQARFIADMPQLAGNNHRVDVDGAAVTLTDRALAVLAELSDEDDGHYDGEYIWIGGHGYPVRHGWQLLQELISTRAVHVGAKKILADAAARRDALICDAMRARVDRDEIAMAAGVKRARIYQIRDGV
jgi:hypothetical protein